jgi:sugar/nucleoside kinase (ribokinase family)
VTLAFGIPGFDPVAAGWLSRLDPESTLLWDGQGWLSKSRDSASVRSLPPVEKIYLANEGEAAEEANCRSLEEVIAAQPPVGFRAAIIKRGVDGVFVAERLRNGGVQVDNVASFPVTALSTIGTGDVFAGAAAARIIGRNTLVDAARWGCAAASVSLSAGTNLLGESALVEVERLVQPDHGE